MAWGVPPIIQSGVLRGNSLPEVTTETALFIEILDAKSHAHLHAGIDLPLVDVGDVGHQSPAFGEGYHAVVARRIHGKSQKIGGPRKHRSPTPRKTLRVLAVHRFAVGIYAYARAGKLSGPANAAFSARKPKQHVALAVLNREGRALVDFGAHAFLKLDEPVERQIFKVVRLFLAAGQRSLDAPGLPMLGNFT